MAIVNESASAVTDEPHLGQELKCYWVTSNRFWGIHACSRSIVCICSALALGEWAYFLRWFMASTVMFTKAVPNF